MPGDKSNDSNDILRREIEQARRRSQASEQGYRAQALRILPPICAKCGREFSGRRLRELTVHHRDHNHENNPPDGSNWELLCLYCHENEHARRDVGAAYAEGEGERQTPPASYKPFADLARVLKKDT